MIEAARSFTYGRRECILLMSQDKRLAQILRDTIRQVVAHPGSGISAGVFTLDELRGGTNFPLRPGWWAFWFIPKYKDI